MFMKVHHAIGDGLGVMIMLSTLQDNYSPNQWIQTTEVLNGFMAWILYILKPLTLIYAFLWFFFWKIDKNIIKPANPKLSGKKNNVICKAFDVNTMKKIGAHFNKATINDVVLSLTSMSIKEYMQNHNDDSKSINVLIPYSLREVPKLPD